MNQEKFSQAIDALTQAVVDNKPAADALQLLVADYYLAQARMVDLNKTIVALGIEAPLADVLRSTEDRRKAAIMNLEDLSEDGKKILRNLSEAQQDVGVALKKMEGVIKQYVELNANVQTLADNSKKLLGGAVKSFLGPAAEFGPVKEIADKLFG